MGMSKSIRSVPTWCMLVLFTTVFPRPGLGMYDPRHGRWLQRDPVGLRAGVPLESVNSSLQYSDGMNLYQYVKSQPGNHQDSTGLLLVKCCKPARAILGSKHCWLAMVDGSIWEPKCVGMGAADGATSASDSRCGIDRSCESHASMKKGTWWPDPLKDPVDGSKCTLITFDDAANDCIRREAAMTERKIKLKGCCWSANCNCENMINSWLRKCGLKWTCVNKGFCKPVFE